MTEADLERVMKETYAQVFNQILSSLFKSDPKLSHDYMSAPIGRQREIDSEIKTKSEKMAASLVAKLKDRGFLSQEPPESDLETLIRSTIEEFGSPQ